MSKVSRQYLPPVLAGGILLCCIAVWALYEVERDLTSSLRELRQSSNAIASALQGSMFAEVRAGRVRRARLETIFENVVATTDLQAIRLRAGDRVLAEAGDVSLLPTTMPPQGEGFVSGAFVHWESMDLRECPVTAGSSGHGMGRMQYGGRGLEDYDIDLAADTQVLIIARATTGLEAHQRRARQRGWSIAGAGALATMALIAAWIASVRGQMLQRRLESSEHRARQMEELELAALGVAHETKHPLGIIRGLAQQLHDEAGAGERLVDSTEQIMEEADVAVNRLGDFMQYARIRSPVLQAVNLSAVIQRVAELLQPDTSSLGVDLRVDVGASLTALADAEMLTQVLVNLLRNSLRACAAGDEILVSAKRGEAGLELVVKDTGDGIPAALLENVCKPYVTGRADGHGIGLAIVQRIAEAHGWQLAVESVEGDGTRVSLTCMCTTGETV